MFRQKAGPMTPTIQNVSDTALHGGRLPHAVPRHFVGAWSVVIRTVIIDDYIRQAIAAGVDTILNLSAGLDTGPTASTCRARSAGSRSISRT